ncbi:uncharacterized protein LOC143857069 [Tasmannia lanceolata]|uniref:uncharacterized protein LOC143857069 n=1 Tax=Tasmannia lanceolata TaxID=3420 RepID=UPI0040638632
MRAFADFIAEHELVDLPLASAFFTWSRGESRSRLDHFSISPGWLDLVTEVFQRAWVHSESDHCPILLDPRLESWGPPPFIFKIAWLSSPHMEDRLGEWWVSCLVEGPADVVIGHNLRFVMKELEEWVEESKKQLVERKQWLENRMEELVALDESGFGGGGGVGGVGARRRRNRIEALNVDGLIVSSEEGVSAAVVDFFSSLYSFDNISRPLPEEVEFNSLSLEECSKLERPFEIEEIEKGVFSLAKDKAPGLDGFCLAFFQACWSVVKNDILRFFREFHEGMSLDRDDTLLFCAPDIVKIMNLKATLRCYELITGQRSNFQKSRLYALNISAKEACNFAKILGFKLDSLPSSYLGLPLGVGRLNKSLWDPIVERIERRLETWKRNLVSKGGRLTLVKSVLDNILVYYLSLFKFPVNVSLRIEQIQRRFLWSGSDDKKGIPLVKWEKVCISIKNGGLGIRRIKGFNQALLCKWLWRFGEEESSLWVKVIGSYYGFLSGKWEYDNIFAKNGLTVARHFKHGARA